MLKSLLELMQSWRLHLAALNHSPHTLASYTAAVKTYLHWCRDCGDPAPMTKASIQRFHAATLAAGTEPNTARLRHYALKTFATWLVEEGELDTHPFAGLHPPKMTTKVTPSLTDSEITAMLATCSGATFLNRRDEAIIRFMTETGTRSSELVAMTCGAVNLSALTAVIEKGKGGKGRMVPFSASTAAAIDRYLRARRKIVKPDVDALWLSTRGKGMSYDTLYAALKSRAAAAGMQDFYPHLTRNTAATRWLRKGGSEAGLMAIAGWSSRAMIDRYTAASATERAIEEARRLDLGM